MSEAQRYIKNYFKRFADLKAILQAPISPENEMTVVIPCHNEPDLICTLESLDNCEAPNCQVEVIVVVNQSENQEPHSDVSLQNQATIEQFEEWNKMDHNRNIKYHLLKALDLPKKHAGVGLARKIGMDEALRRFDKISKSGTIICLDADCTVSNNYLKAIYQEFHLRQKGIGELHYEHLYELEPDHELREGIINYELHLRYYVDGLRLAGFPNAIQTVGSCMLVKSDIYAKHGGMNKRKAGEDFYFLHKIVPHEDFVEVKGATVYPSCRVSDRVPFGTGKAQQDWLDKESTDYVTYDPQTFTELKTLFHSLEELYENDRSNLSPIVISFFDQHNYWQKVDLIQKNSPSINQFVKQFYTWFDAFLCMKFMHYCRDHHFPNVPIIDACLAIYPKQNGLIDYLTYARQNE